MKSNVSITTVHSIKRSYLESIKENRGEVITSLPVKKRGRPLLLGESLDRMVQKYLKKVREGGGVVTARVVVAAARAIILTQDRSKLVEFGGHIELNRAWAFSLLRRMKFVKRKATTAKSKLSSTDFAQAKKDFLESVVTTVEMEEIPPELILNWDQTGIKLVPVSAHTMDREGSKRVEVTGVSDKRLITALFCGSLTGDFLPMQVVYKGTTNRCHPHYKFPLDWHITHSPNHWSTENTMLDYIKEVIIPYVKRQRELLGEEKPSLVIMDNFKGQITSAVNSLLEDNDIHVCLLPPNTTDRLQPLDVSVNKPAKDFLRRQFENWYTAQIMKQLDGKDIETSELEPIDLSMKAVKEQGAKWLVEWAEYMADNPQIIVNGFIKAGISAALDGNLEDPDDVNEDELEAYEADIDSESEFDYEAED